MATVRMSEPAHSVARPLRVLHVISTLTGGGAQNFLCALAEAFDESVVHTGIMPVYPTPVPSELRRSTHFDLISVDRKGRYDPGFLGRMLSGVRTFRPDIVHAHLHNGKYWGRLIAIAAHVPIVVFTEHSPKGDKRLLPEILVDEVLNRITDGVITFTNLQRSMLARVERIPPAKLRVIENGIPMPPAPDSRRRIDAKRRLGAAGNDYVILVLGRLEPIKNVQLAVRAMLHVPATSHILMCVIGDGSQMRELRALAKSLRVSQRVVFLGHQDDAIDLLYGGDALFLPSLVEGMPLAALEAMAVGLPVISTPWPGSDELLRNGEFGMVTTDWDAETAAAAFRDAATHAGDFREKGMRALQWARSHYDIRRSAREHEHYYAELAHRKGLR